MNLPVLPKSEMESVPTSPLEPTRARSSDSKSNGIPGTISVSELEQQLEVVRGSGTGCSPFQIADTGHGYRVVMTAGPIVRAAPLERRGLAAAGDAKQRLDCREGASGTGRGVGNDEISIHRHLERDRESLPSPDR